MASSIPQFHLDYTFTPDFFNFPAPLVAGGSDGGTMWGQQSSHMFDDGVFDVKPPQESDFAQSVSTMLSYPERLGVLDMVVPALPELKTELCGIARFPNFGGGYNYRPEYVCDFGVECSRIVSDFRPDFSTTTGDNLGTQGKPIPAIEESNIKVGQYSVEERKDRILRYLEKRNRRNFNKTIKYECRKTLADRRVRVRGRFARNNELSEEELIMKKNNNDPQESKGLYYGDLVQNQSDDDWLQEAMESLMYVPYNGGKCDGAIV